MQIPKALLWLALLSLTNLLKIPTAIAVEQIAVEDFVKLPGARNVKISPDGKHLSLVFNKDGEDRLAVLDRATRKPIGQFRVRGEGKGVGTVRWVNNERLIYTVTESYAWNKQKFANGELIGVNVDGKKHDVIFGYRSGENSTNSRLAKKANNGNHEIIDMLEDDKKNILIAFYPWKVLGNKWVNNSDVNPIIYKLNTYTGKTRKMGHLAYPNATGITDNNGDVRFSVSVDDDNKLVISYKTSASADWQDWSAKDFDGSKVVPLSFTADNNQVYIMANAGEGTRALYLLDLKSQAVSKVVHDDRVDISRLIRDFSGRRIVAVGTDLGLPEYQYLDAKDKAANLHLALIGAFKGQDVVLTSATKDGSLAIAYAYSDTNAGSYYLFETKSMKASYLVGQRTWIKAKTMATTESLTIKTRDGSSIYGYLTKPQGKDKNLPLVVLPHGGPHGVRDFWGFDWEVQLLANRGYAVLQLNYRGSDGFGLAYEDIGKGKWGTLMQDDLTDATKAMIESGVADAKRICMFGASYGGYAALMGAVREPELYRCVIGSAGVYNLPMMFTEGDIADRQSGLAYLKEVLGENQADLKSRSPVFNVDKIKANVLLIHGAKDQRAPMEQVESLKAAFDKIGKKYQWMEIGNEAHGYYDEENRLKVYNKVLAFLDANIGG